MSIKLLFFIILLVGCLTQVASDIYAPALPSIAVNFNASLNSVQWSMAIYMVSAAATQMIYGVISEGIGRKNPLLFGLGVMFIGSLVCIAAPNIHILILGRFIQGCGTGACASMWRSIFRDVFSGHELAKYGSYLTAFIIFIVPAAPALGAYLTHYLNWRYTFIFLTLYTIVTLFCVYHGYRETSQHHHPERLKITFIKGTFRQLFTSRIYVGCSLSVFMTYGGLFAWMIAAPILLIHIAGMSMVAFGWLLFLGGGSAFGLAGLINGRWVKQLGMANMMRLGWAIMFISGILLLTSYLWLGIRVWTMAGTMLLYYFASAFIYPNANAMALTPFGKIVGYAGSTYGFIQTIGAGILGGIISHLHEQNPIPVAIVTILASILAWICYEWIAQKSLNGKSPNES